MFLCLCLTFAGAAGAAPTQVWVDDDYSATAANDGHTWNGDAFATIQAGIDAVAEKGTVNIKPGLYRGAKANKKGITIISDPGVVIEGASPALTVESDTTANGGLFRPTPGGTGNDPAILITGGTLTLRNATVIESSANDQVAIKIEGGGLDAGTAATAGNNTICISNSLGAFIYNGSSSAVSAIGNTWKQDGTTLTDNFAIEDEIYHALDNASYGLVTWVADNAFVTTGTLGVQQAIAAVPSGYTINLTAGTFTPSGQVAISKNLSLIGAGAGSTILKTDANTTAGGNVQSEAWVYLAPTYSLTLKDLTLDGTGQQIHHALQSRGTLTVNDCAIKNIKHATYLGRGIVLYGGTAAITNVTLSNIERIGIHVRGNVMTPAPVATLVNCAYTGKGTGDHLDYAYEVGGGGQAAIINCSATACLGVASTDGSTSAGVLATDYWGTGTTLKLTGSTLTGNTTGVTIGYNATDATKALLQGNDLTGNTTAGISITGGTVDAGQVGGSDITGLGISTGGNNLTGYGSDNTAPWAVLNSGTGTVLAFNNDFGTVANVAGFLSGTNAGYSQSGAAYATCPGPVTVECAAPSGATNLAGFLAQGGVFSATVANSVGFSDGPLSPGPAEGTITRTYSLTDLAGNSTTCTQTVTVDDTIPPTITCPANVTVNADSGVCYATGVSLGTPTTGDNCGVGSVNNNAPTQFPVGSTTVTWTVTDTSGLTATCPQTVTVIDNQNPAVTCAPLTITLDGTGNYTLSAGDIAALVASASDNCGVATTNVSKTSFTFCDRPSQNVTVTVTDVNGNPSSCSATITINTPAAPSVVYVDAGYPGTCTPVNWPYTGSGAYFVGFNAFATIQAAINAVAPGGTVNVAAGTFNEAVSLNKAVTVDGAGSGSTASDTIIQNNAVAQVVAISASAVTLKDVRVDGRWHPSGGSVSDACIWVTGTITGLTLDNVVATDSKWAGLWIGGSASVTTCLINNSSFSNNDKWGMQVDGAASMNGLTISGSHFDGNASASDGGGIAVFMASGSGSVFNNVLIDNTTFNNNFRKGVYFEKLNNAELRGVTILNTGTVANGAGIDINLKFGTYQNIVLRNLSVSGSGGSTVAAVVIKGRNDAPSYNSNPALLNGLTLDNVSITSSTTDLSIGNNVAGIAMSGVALGGTGTGFAYWTSPAVALNLGDTAFAVTLAAYLANTTTQPIDAMTATFDGKLGSAMSQAEGFAVENKVLHKIDLATLGLLTWKAANVFVTPLSFYTPNTTPSVQRGIDAASPTWTVNVAAGTYAERLTVSKTLTFLGAQAGVDPTPSGARTTSANEPIITEAGLSTPNPDVLIEIPLGVNSVVFDGFTLSGDQVNTTADTSVIRCWGDGAIVRNNIIDGMNDVIFKGGTGFTLDHNRVVANKTGFVVQPGAATSVFVTGNIFTPGTALQNDPSAINLTGVNGAAVSGNTASGWYYVAGSNGRALAASGVNNLAVSCNTFTGNRDAVSIFGGSTFLIISANSLTGSARYGINIKGQDIQIANNDITGNGSAAISIDRHVIDTLRVAIAQNDLSANPSGLVIVSSQDKVNAENNWWGNATGPAHAGNAGGTGSAVVGTIGVGGIVDYSPWLGLPGDTSPACGIQPNLTPVYYLPHHLVFNPSPGNGVLDVIIPQQPIVQVIDENNGVAQQFISPIGLAIGNNSGGGVLAGTTPKNAVAGTATFTDIKMTVGGGAGFTLVASSLGPLTNLTSGAFDIDSPAPAISSLSPYWARAGGSAFTLTVTGNNFVPTSKVQWGGSDRPTAFVNATTLTATISAGDIASPASVQVKVVTPAPGGGTTAELTFRIEAAAPTVVYVDDGYVGLAADTLVDWPYSGAGTHIIGYDAFATIQGGVTAVAVGGIVHVAGGTYAEYVVVNKSADLRGPNYGISPNDGSTRQPEATILPPVTDTTAGTVVTITAANVSIDGFTVDGDNPALPESGVGFGGAYGASMDAWIGIRANADGLVNVVVRHNIARNFANSGIRLQQVNNHFATTVGATFSYNNAIEDNHVAHIMSTGIRLMNSMYGAVKDNVISNAVYGLYFYSMRTENKGAPASKVISGNTVLARAMSLWFNLYSATPYTVSDNTIKAFPDASKPKWYGIMMSTVSGAQNFMSQINLPKASPSEFFTFTDNAINGADLDAATTGYGYWFWHLDNYRDDLSVDHFTTITGGSVSSVDVGVFLHNVDTDPNTAFGNATCGAHATISGTAIAVKPGGKGIYLKDDPAWVTGNPAPLIAKRDVKLTIGSGVTVSGGAQGLVVEQPYATVQGTVADLALSGQTSAHIQLVTNPNNIDATTASFEGKTGAAMSLAELYATEDKILHKLDNAALGLVRVKAANVYVTTASGSIQRGIDAATAGDTVNVNAGTYAEKVLLNKPITVSGDPGDLAAGPGPNAPTLDGSTLTAGDGFTIPRNTSLSGITVEGFIIRNFSNGGGGNGVGVGVISWENTSTNVTIRDNTFTNLGYNGVYVGTDSDDMQSNWLVQRNIVYGAPYAGIELTDVSNCQVLDNVIYAPSVIFDDPGDAGVGIEIAARARVGTVTTGPVLVQGNIISGAFASGSRAGINLLARAYNSGSADARLSGIAVQGNEVTGSGTRGVDVVAESRNGKPSLIQNLSITQNTLTGNATGIQVGDTFVSPKANGTYDVGTITIQQNNLELGSAFGLNNLSAVTVNAPNNWWGNLSGPSSATVNLYGTGVPVVGVVTVSPWLALGTDTLPGTIGFQPAPGVNYIPTHLAFSTQPVGAPLGSPLATQPIVQVLDVNNVVTPWAQTNINLVIGNNPGGGTLTGTIPQFSTSGVATFTNLAITVGGGVGYTLVASAPSLTSATSAAFDIGNPTPSIASLNPAGAVTGSGNVSVTIAGANFVPMSVVLVNNGQVTAAYNSVTQLVATLSTASAGSYSVVVSNPAVATTSGALTFTVGDQPAVVYVDDNYGPGNSGSYSWGYNAFSTVQAGVNAVTNGGTVNVFAGTYTEAVTANKPVTLLGANAGTACAGSGDSVINGGAGTAVTSAAANVTVDGFALNGAIGVSDTTFTGAVVRNNQVNAGAQGVAMQNILSGTFTIEANCITLSNQWAGVTPSVGIAVAGTTGGATVIEDNIISGAFYGCVLYGVNNSPAVTVKGGTITGVMQGVAVINVGPAPFNTPVPSTFAVDGVNMSGFSGSYPAADAINFHAGVYVFSGSNSPGATVTGLITNVTITGTGNMAGNNAALYFADFSTVSSTMQTITVVECSIQSNLNRGILASGPHADVTVSRCTLSNNGSDGYSGYNAGYGIYAFNGATLQVSETVVNNPATVAVGKTVTALVSQGAAASTLTVFNSSITAGAGLLASHSSGTLNASGNWWGGTSDTTNAALMSGSVDFTPYLASGTDSATNAGFQGDFSTLHVTALACQPAGGRIQEGINLVSGSKVIIEAGNYVENVLANKNNLELAGVGQASVTVVPALSGPNPGGGSLASGSSHIVLVQANNVKIHDLTLDGNNTNLTSGVIRGGVDVDARNGIITDHSLGIFSGLEVYNMTVKNIYLRGIYASSGGSFNFHHNTVQNVQGEANSIAIMVWASSGVIAFNTVSDANDAIAGNHSTGTQFLTNTVTASGSGVHSDNNGSMGGVADLLQGNNVSAMNTGAYGVWVFAPYRAVSVIANVVSGCEVGLACAGQMAVVTPVFGNNTVTAGIGAGSVGVYQTTSLFGWGSADVAALFQNNHISGTAYGVYLEAEPTYDLAATIEASNIVTGNQYGVYADGVLARVKLQNSDLTANTGAGIQAVNGAIVDVGACGLADITGLGSSSGGNNLAGYGFDTAAPWAIVNNASTVRAYANSFGASVGQPLSAVLDGIVSASQSGGLLVTPTLGGSTVQCPGDVPPATNTLAAFVGLGGVVSATDGVTVTSSDTPITGANAPYEGTLTRTYTLVDACLQTNTATQVFTVDDTLAPVVTTWPTNRTLNVDGQCQVQVPNLTAEVVVTDNCSLQSTNQNPAAGTWVSLGVTNVIVTVADNGGNSVSSNVVLTIVDTSPAPSVTYVDDDYTNMSPGTVVTISGNPHYVGCDAFGTIQAGINRVAANGTVNVAAGLYKEQVDIAKGLTVIGDVANPDNVVIDGENTTTLPSNGQVRLFNPTGAVVFKGFTIINWGAYGVGNDHFAILTKGSNSRTIQNCKLIGHGAALPVGFDYGIWAAGGSSGELVIKDTYMSGMYHAILLERQTGPSTIEGNTFDALYTGPYGALQAGGRAIEMITYASTDITNLQRVALNKFVNFKSTGVQISGGFAGETPSKFSNVLIESNDFSFASSDIFNLNGAIHLINVSGSPATNSSPAGGVAATIRNNIISVPSGKGIWIKGLNGAISCVNNSIIGTPYGLDAALSLGSTIDASGNWWGASSAAGVAATITTNADYTPWLDLSTDVGGDLTDGFQGDFSTLHVDDNSPQVGSTGRIQEGHDLVTTAGTVQVEAGTYAGNITVNKAVTLVGDPGDAQPGPGLNVAIIDGGSLPGSAFFIANGVANVTIKGFEMRNFTSNTSGVGNGVSAWETSTANISIEDNYFHNLGWNGVLVGNDSPFAGNHTGWMIKGNILETFEYYGFELTDTSNSTIENNIIHADLTSAPLTCIMIMAHRSESGITISGNTIDGAMPAWSAGFAPIFVAAGDSGGGVASPCVLSDISIENNLLSTTGGRAQVYLANYSGGSVTGVTLHENTLASFRNSTTASVDATSNWWGSITGPAIASNAGGSGGAIAGGGADLVDFSPWLANGTDTLPLVVGFQPNLTPLYYTPAGLVFSTQPVGNVGLGVALSTQPVVTVTNEIGGTATQFTNAVSLAITLPDPHGGILAGTMPVNAVGGVATFTDINMTVSGGAGYQLDASSLAPLAGATSAAFSIDNPAPVLVSIAPTYATAGGATFTLTVNGTNFFDTSVVQWNGSTRPTTYVSHNQLTAQIAASDITSVGSASVTVFTPTPGGGTSSPLTFWILPSGSPTNTFVDDSYVGLPTGTIVKWPNGGSGADHYIGYDAFATVQGGITAVASTYTVYVAAGTYLETATFASSTKQFNLVGETGVGGVPLPIIHGSLSIDLPGTDNNWSIENINFLADTNTPNVGLVTLQNVHGVLINNCTFDGAGRFMAAGYKNGINFVSGPNGNDTITIRNSTFTNGLYVAVGGTYAGLTLTNSTIQNVKGGINQQSGAGDLVVDNCEIGVVAQAVSADSYCIRFASTDAGSARNLTVTRSRLAVNHNSLVPNSGTYHSAIVVRSGANGTLVASNCSIDGEVVNLCPVALNASGNWWVSNDTATVLAAANAGVNVDYTPWLDSGTDTDSGALGFKGDFSAVHVDDSGSQVGGTGRIQEGVNLVTASTVYVHSGTYTEGPQILINKNVSLIGDGLATTIIKPAADTGTSGDAKAWWLVDDGKLFNLHNVTLDGSGYLIHTAIRHKGSGTLSDCAFINIQYDAGGGSGHAYQGTAIGVHTSGNVDVTGCYFSGIGRIGVAAYDEYDPLPTTGPTGTYSGNTYVGKGTGDFLDYAFQVQAGANITITSNNVSACRGVAYDGSGSSAVAVWDDPSTKAEIRNNSFLNNTSGVAVGVAWASSNDPVLRIEGNTASGGEIGLELLGGISLVQSNILTGNTLAAIHVGNDATVDAGDLLGRNLTGLGTSTGGNNLSGYGFNETAPWAIDASGSVSPGQVLAYSNDFGAASTEDINKLVADGFDVVGPVVVEFSQAGPLTAVAPTNVTVECAGSIPAAATNLASYIAQGGVVSASPVTITSLDANYVGFPIGDGPVLRTYTLTDACSRVTNAVQTITVDDVTPPSITCPAPVLATNDLNQCYVTGVVLGTPSTNDNCGVASVVNNAPTQFPVGNTTVTWTVTDNSGLTNYCTQLVTVLDLQAPAATAGTIASCYTTQSAAEAAALAATSATDNCGVLSTNIQSTVGTCSAVITVRVTDIHANFTDVVYTTRIDGTAPTIGAITATQLAQNVLNTNTVLQGVVDISVAAADNCSLVDGHPSIELVNGTSTNYAVCTATNAGPTYIYTWNVSSNTANGTWTATVSAFDLCQQTNATFTLNVNKTQLGGQIALQNFAGTNRVVVFKATTTSPTATNVVATWTLTLAFTNGVAPNKYATYTLTGVPDGVTGLSAKTDWNLRRRLALTLDGNGQAVVNFTGASLVRGGDIGPATRDNAVQLSDYLALLANWHTTNPVADIDGNGSVSTADYGILSSNWYTTGDPQ